MRVAIFVSFLLLSTSAAVAELFSADQAIEPITSIVENSGARPKIERLGCKETPTGRECLYVDYGDIVLEFRLGPDSKFRAPIVEGPKLLDNRGAYLDAVIEVIDSNLSAEERRKFVKRVLERYSQRPTDPRV